MNCPDYDVASCMMYNKPFHTVYELIKIRLDVENDSSTIPSSSPFSLCSINITELFNTLLSKNIFYYGINITVL